MLIQVAMNNIESVEQGEEILKKWHYHLDEDQSHVVMERDTLDATIRISGFHPWADEMDEDGSECSCGGDGDNCECNGNRGKNADDATAGKGEEIGDGETEDDESDEDSEESEVIYLGQALFVPAEDQARVLATELTDDDYIGTVSVSVKGIELTDTDAFRALPADTKDAVIAAIEELGDAETYLSLYEVMGLKD
ncbi:MAG: hypothetical protein NTV26_03115 [Caldiserica bacterium]|nr:hypothetical protein [Caldisericota bacterium]